MVQQTSLASYFIILSSMNELQRKVYKSLELVSDQTDCDLEKSTGLKGSTLRPRRIELEKLDLIECSGKVTQRNGRTARTWRVKKQW
jgi:transcription initiation factor IIE alpha subunit